MRRKLESFAGCFDDCFSRKPTGRHLRTYMAGQLGSLPRKSVEPIALESGVPPRTLQEFLGLHRWDHEKMRRRVLERVLEKHRSGNAVALIDETSFPKKGAQTAGVQRQHCGATGKTDNCVVAVYLGYAAENFQTLVDADLYLPQEAWAEDSQRRDKAGIPEELCFRTKGQIALELLRNAQAAGADFKYLSADELYGSSSQFRAGVAELGITYVLEVSPMTCGWTRAPRFELPADSDTGRPHTRLSRAKETPPTRRVDRLWKRGGPSWHCFHIKDTEKGPVVWEVRATRFWPSYDGQALAESWLLVARHVLTGELKYFLSNAAADTPIETLLRVAFSRAGIEQLFETAKGEIGLDHFEVRRYLPLVRHLIVSLASLLFLMEQTTRFREKKPLVECVPDQGRSRSAA